MMALKYICDRLQDYNINFFVNELVEASKNLGILQAKIDAYKFNSILIPMFHRKEVMSSMDIEGTQRTTLSDICEREVDPKLHDEKESIEIRNHTKALIFGAEHLRANKFTHSFIQEVHKIMLTDVEPPNPDKPIGKYKIKIRGTFAEQRRLLGRTRNAKKEDIVHEENFDCRPGAGADPDRPDGLLRQDRGTPEQDPRGADPDLRRRHHPERR